VENLFSRAKALNQQSRAVGRPVLQAQAELTALLEEPGYTDQIKARILDYSKTGDRSWLITLRPSRRSSGWFRAREMRRRVP
jgi:hypothetical protein